MVIQLQRNGSRSGHRGLTGVVELAGPVGLQYFPNYVRPHAVGLIGCEHAVKSGRSPHGRPAKNVRCKVSGLHRVRSLSCRRK